MKKTLYSLILAALALSALPTSVYADTFNATGTGATGTIQTYTVPSTGSYTIEAWGAQGGGGITNNVAGGLGAYAKGTVSLTAGDVLQILVGQQGGTGSSVSDPQGNENGGGGGTFVVKQTGSVPLVVAGGGGGGYSTSYGTSCTRTASDGSGQSTTTGMTINCNGTGSGGSGGAGGSTAGSYQGGAGGGFSTNGANGGTHCSVAMGGQSFTNGGAGGAGNTCYSSANFGGFGGGGGGQLGGPGAGGGYSGGGSAGGWSSYSTYGGGGGSYIIAGATGTVLTAGSRSGAGQVIITPAGGGAAGSITLRGSRTGTNSGGSSVTINVPAGTTTNDVMVAGIFANGNWSGVLGVTVPTGWTEVQRINNTGGSMPPVIALYYHKVTGAEPASYTWGFTNYSGGAYGGGWIASFVGVDTNSPIDVSGSQLITNTSAYSTPSITTTTDNEMLVWNYAGNCANSFSVPTGASTISTAITGGCTTGSGFYKNQAVAGASGSFSSTASSSYGGAAILALRPFDPGRFYANGSGATGSIQTFTAPSTGKYRILAKGASGGKNASFAVTGGAGASMQGDFYLTAGDVLNIMVGQAGGDGQGGGGGGGTFVVKSTGNIPLVVAGGGGGAHQQNGDPGSATNNGTPNGGTGFSYGTGGGGFSTNGTVGGSGPGAGITAALSYLSGGTGGSSNTGGTAIGGYGGGGGAHSGCGGACGAGGGGGYNGGNVQLYYGNGGGSFNAGINQANTQGANTGNGSVTITNVGGSAGPLVISPTKAGITSSGATLGGNVTSDGGSGVTTRGVCVSTAANPALGGTCFTAGVPSGTGVFTANATILNINTTYYYRAYATNANGTTYSPNDTFTTLNVTLPTITSSTKVTTSSSNATLGANVTSDGGAAITRRGVCYSTTDTTPGYSALDTPEAGVTCQTTTGTTGVFTVNVAVSVGTYNFRAFAYNSQGYQYTANDPFTVLAAPTGLNPSTTTSNGLRTITWNAVPNAAFYYIRIDDKVDGWTTPPPTGCDNGGTPTTGDVCQKPTTNSYSYNFQAGHTYSYWVHAGNSVGYGTATTIDPVTVIAPPVITIVSDSTTTTQAVLTAKINPNSYSSSAFFKWSTSASDTCATMANTVSVLSNQTGTADITFSTTLQGLNYGTNYYYCAGGTNTYGTSYSDGASYSSTGTPKMITTATPQPITVTKTASYISSVARVMGTVNPNGPAGSMWFKWGPGAVADCATLPYSTTQQVMTTGTTDVDFYDSISGLVTGTTYTYCAVAKNPVNNAVYGAPVQFTAPTGCIPPASGDFAISSNCQLQNTYDGVDTATGAKDLVNTATLTVNDGKTLTVGPGKSVGYGTLTRVGSSAIVKFSNAGGIIKRGPLWAADSDNDGYPDSTATALFTDSATTLTAPSGYVRRSYAATNGIDCSPLNGYVFENISNMATDADHDGYYIGSPASLCVGKNSSVNGRAYWNDPTNNYNYIYAGTGGPFLGANDCDDTNPGPCPVTNLSATQATASRIDLSWSAAGGPVPTSYDIFWCTGSSSCTPLSTNKINTTSTSYQHALACGNTWYGYNIVAKNAAGSSSVSTPNKYQQTGSCCTNMTVYTDTDMDGKGNSGTITSGDARYTNSSTLNMPVGVQNGTVLIAAVLGSSQASSAPSGWTFIRSQGHYLNFLYNQYINLFYRVATGAETTPVSFSAYGSSGIIAAYNGVDIVSPTDGSGASTISYSDTNSINTAAFSTTTTNTKIVMAIANNTGAKGVAPSGWSKVLSGGSLVLMDKTLGSTYNSASTYTTYGNFQGASTVGVALRKSTVNTNTQCVTGGVATGAWSVNQNDCNDNTSALDRMLNGYKDRDGDTRVSTSQYSVCSGASLPTGYVSSPAGNDCDDADGSIYQNLTGYKDADQDGYTISTSSQVCSGASLPSGYLSSVSTSLDCYDNNKCARPGQTSYFSVNRGSSTAQCDQTWNGYEWALTGGGNGQNDSAGNTPNSFDFNCAGGEEKNPGQAVGFGQYYDCPNTVIIHAAPACQYVEIYPECSCFSYSSCCPCTPSCGVTPNQTYCSSTNATIGTCGQQLSDGTQYQMVDNATCGGTGSWTWVYGMMGQLQCR